ncbi:hypothetical protein HYE36_04445 [Mycoplasmopsis bovis]|nr:hypothetical protein [Mycoplasmopsis bovis]WHL49130.1 hypothetical protein HYE36_04445 [Mycoplasmopsis bovis]
MQSSHIKALVYNPNPFYIKGIQAFAMQDVQNREATKKMFSYIVDNQFFNTSYLDNVLKPLYHSAKKPYTLIYAKNDQFTTEAEMLKPNWWYTKHNSICFGRMRSCCIFSKSK